MSERFGYEEPERDLLPVDRVIELFPVPVTVLTSRGMSLLANQAYCDALGLPREVILSRSLEEALHPDDVDIARSTLSRVLQEGKASSDLRLRHRDEHYLTVRWDLHFEGSGDRIIAIASDRTSERQRLAEAQERARTDTLTGVLSRAGLMDALDARRRSHPGGGLVVALIDIDGFKKLNDTMGHQVGDRVLCIVARRLEGAVPDDGQVGRLGGDEFVVLASDVESLSGLADAIQSAFETPVEVDGRQFEVGASVGLSRSSAGDTVDDLLRHADVAAYEAKRSGRRRSCVATEDLVTAWQAARQTERELATALGTGQFVPYYQPIVTVSNEQADTHEVLLRWLLPDGSVRPAGEFIEVAASSGLLPAMSTDVRRAALMVAGRLPHLRFALNVSAHELLDHGFEAEMRSLVEVNRVRADQVIIEVTEQTALNDLDRAAGLLGSLRDAGFVIALDDFGSGYSSLTYLTQLPIDLVKLDGAFLRAATEQRRGRRILSAVAEFLHSIELTSVIEGVETEADHLLACELGIELGQGWYYGRPAPAASLFESSAPSGRWSPVQVSG